MTAEALTQTLDETQAFALQPADGHTLTDPSESPIQTIPLSIRLLDNIMPPQPDPNDKRDPAEVQIYNLLGDITLPRSFLPTIKALSQEKQEREKRAFEVRFAERPDDLLISERGGFDWPGKAPEIDARMIEEREKEILESLIGTREMAQVRREASKIFNQYIASDISHSSLAESHFTRASMDLWLQMSTFAKDFLLYGGKNRNAVDIAEIDINGALDKIFETAQGFRRTADGGTVYIDTNEPEEFYNWNSISFTFTFGWSRKKSIDGIRIEEGTSRNQHSPLLSFIQSQRDLAEVFNNFADGYHVGPFHVGVEFHEYGKGEHNVIIDINPVGWTDEQIRNFLGEYLQTIKREPKNGGKPAKHQLLDCGILTLEV